MANSDGFKTILKSVEKAFKKLHANGRYKPEDLAKTKEYKNLIKETSNIFEAAITDNDVPEQMSKSLKEDVFIFSGLKTHAQLLEASKLLLTDDGKVKSFSAFSKDVQSIKENYNQNYLEAEYQFAVSSAQSAGNWASIGNDYDLQYRTAGDDRVRDSHDKLRDITLSADDAFWISYYPPNGWRCRCTAVQVRKGKYEVSNSKNAIAEGKAATSQIGKDGKNKLEIFRFNPGMQKVVFPPEHPYSKVAGAEKVKEEIKKEIKKEIEHKNLSIEDFKKLYNSQDIDKSKEKIIMNNDDGYVATGNSFRLNERLRYGYNLEGDDKTTVKALDDLIEKNTLKDNIMLHRNVDDNFISNHFDILTWGKDTKEIIEKLKNSDKKHFSDAGFCSTSAVEKKNVFQQRKIQLKIKAKKGTNAFVTSNSSESEVILSRNQKFNIVEIKEIENDRIRITVETD